tara:strand:+ start:54 stop:458 length:405 start_codon:yes stop_codon:yes gene_type:complete
MSKKKLIIKDIDLAIKNLKKNDTKDNESKDEKLKIKSKKELAIEEISKIYDPEIPVNIYELGLIYDIIIENDNSAQIKMTLTSPNCPVAESLPQEVKDSVMQVEGIENVDLKLVWDPPWNKDMMSEAAKLELNL